MSTSQSHLDENDAEQEPGEHLAEDDEEQGLGGRQPAEAQAQVPAVVQAQGQQLQPPAPALLSINTCLSSSASKLKTRRASAVPASVTTFIWPSASA